MNGMEACLRKDWGLDENMGYQKAIKKQEERRWGEPGGQHENTDVLGSN